MQPGHFNVGVLRTAVLAGLWLPKCASMSWGDRGVSLQERQEAQRGGQSRSAPKLQAAKSPRACPDSPATLWRLATLTEPGSEWPVTSLYDAFHVSATCFWVPRALQRQKR